MPRTLYALLVGIDQYKPPIPRLYGWINDIDEIEAYLNARADMVEVRILALRNEQATREAVIDGFRGHLAGAGPGDVTLFYYAGHGSQEQAPEQFWHLEPDRRDETLVCYDSRTPGCWDLADKELARLIDEVTDRAGHVAVILDCCHSGAGTRGELAEGVTIRRAPIDGRIRPLDSFLAGVVEEGAGDSRAGCGRAPCPLGLGGWHQGPARPVGGLPRQPDGQGAHLWRPAPRRLLLLPRRHPPDRRRPADLPRPFRPCRLPGAISCVAAVAPDRGRPHGGLRGYPERNPLNIKELRMTLNMARWGDPLELQGKPNASTTDYAP